MSQPSVDAFTTGYGLTRADMQEYQSLYLPDPVDSASPYASPLLAEDLGDLPPALVAAAELDPLRDEGEADAQRLGEANLDVAAWRWTGQIHGSLSFTKLIPGAREYHATVIAALRRAHKIEDA